MESNETVNQEAFDLERYLGTHLPEYDEYVGKHLLISLYYLHHTGEVSHKVQLHGVVTRINEAIIAVERQDNGEEFTIPADMSALKAAAEGRYTLRPSGEVVVNPDYLAVWTITEPDPNDTLPTT